MKPYRFILTVVAGLLVVTVSGCSLRLGDFTAISTKNVPVRYDTSVSVTGKDCAPNFLGIPLGMPNLQEAVDDAIGSNGNALVNQVTYQSARTVIVFGQQCLEVQGEAVTLK